MFVSKLQEMSAVFGPVLMRQTGTFLSQDFYVFFILTFALFVLLCV